MENLNRLFKQYTMREANALKANLMLNNTMDKINRNNPGTKINKKVQWADLKMKMTKMSQSG